MALPLSHELFSSWKALTFSLVVLLAVYSRLKRSTRGPLPPGPTGLPIIGNILSLIDRRWLKFEEWKEQYGPIFSLNIAGQHAVVLGNHKIAADLLDRRASIYSDRGHNLVAGELLTGGLVFAFAQHNDIWRRQRRAAHEALNNQTSKKYHRFQETEAVTLVETIFETPEDWDSHLRRTATSLTMSILYALPPLKDSKDPVIQRISSITEQITVSATPGAYLVDTVYFSWLRYLPRWMCAWRRNAEANFTRDSVLFEGLYRDVWEKVKAGDETPSVSSELIHDPKRNLTDQEAAWLAGTLYLAGSETTASQLSWFMLAMVLHPEAQRRAQEEIDHVVGRDCVPTFKDQDNLPYITALVKETSRWRTVAPTGVPHRLAQDDFYNGYFLPKDTLCIVNVWHLNHDPDVYGPDAADFKPERHLNNDGTLKPSIADTKDENHVGYGFGRRICVGRFVANNSMFIQIAMLLWGFNITPVKDANGKDILPDSMKSVDEGLVVRPESFRCSITPRSEDVRLIISQAKEFYEIP